MRIVVPIVILAALVGHGADQPAAGPAEATPAVGAAPLYEVVRLPSLGGTDTRALAINNRGWVAGWSHDAEGRRRAVLWPNHHTVVSLGTLPGGPHSAVARPGLNNAGVVVGISHIGEVDALNEFWSCELTGALPITDPRLACRGFWWEKGVMRALPTLGGTHGFANSVNERGLAVGWAETDVFDPTCADDQRLQFHGVIWDLRKGTVQALRPFPADSSAAATGINARGQVVGISGDCDQAAGRFSARRAVLWEGDRIIELPNLGGMTWHTPWAINARGDVVGFGNPPTDDEPDFRGRAWYWEHGSDSVVALGVLPGNLFSQANGINASGLIVGVSSGGRAPPDGPGARGVIWVLDEDGAVVLTDLNALIELGPDEFFELAADLNDDGHIAGRIVNRATSERTAAVLIPRE